jgi:hypothetical protein
MHRREVCQASSALVLWCKSQGMSPHDAVVVMTHTIAAIVNTTAQEQGLSMDDVDEVTLVLRPENTKKSEKKSRQN